MRKISTKPRTARSGTFRYGYVASPKQLNGRMEPFAPHWYATYVRDLETWTFDTKRECLRFIREFMT